MDLEVEVASHRPSVPGPAEDAIGPIRSQPAAVREPIPLLGLVDPRLHRGELDPAHRVPGAGDPDRDAGRGRPRDSELDPDASGGVSEAAVRRNRGMLNDRVVGGGEGRPRQDGEEDACRKEPPQAARESSCDYRCSITRSTILYSFASSALMK